MTRFPGDWAVGGVSKGGIIMNAIVRHLSCVAVVLSFGAGCTLEAAPDEQLGESRSAQGSPFFLYLRCNATGWGVDDQTRMTETSLGLFELTYEVTEPWMVSNADTCILTQTDQLNGWGTMQAFFGPARIDRIVVPGGDLLNVQLPGGDAHFEVQYPELGSFHAIANFLQGALLIQAAP